eukprot:6172246-Pyramimonas_sp.AAC.1
MAVRLLCRDNFLCENQIGEDVTFRVVMDYLSLPPMAVVVHKLGGRVDAPTRNCFEYGDN